MGWIQTLLIGVSIVRSESRASRSPCYGGASQCFHYTAFEGISLVDGNEILGETCSEFRRWAEWIHLPNAFGHQRIIDVQNKIDEIANERISDDHKLTLCALMFPSCQQRKRNDRCRAKDHVDFTIFKPVYHTKALNCRSFTNEQHHLAKLLSSNEDENFECLSLLSKIDTKREISTEIVEDELCNGKLNYAHFKEWSFAMRYLMCIKKRYDEVKEETGVQFRIYKIGDSVLGRDLIAVEIYTPQYNWGEEKSLPELRLMGQIHGNEEQGIFILLPMIEELATSTAPEILNITLSMRTHILFCLNPDGYIKTQNSRINNKEVGWILGRNNQRKVDLNRNFPFLTDKVMANEERGRGPKVYIPVTLDHYRTGNYQPETIAIIKWTENHNFVLSAMIHSGAWVFNYPYDTSKDHPQASPNFSEDKSAFEKMALDFTKLHPYIARKTCFSGLSQSDEFHPAGVTNGAAWYSLKGSLQDYAYISRGVMEVTLELGCDKAVHKAQTNYLYQQNRAAFLDFMWHVWMGVNGEVFDEETKEPIDGVVVRVAECRDRKCYWNNIFTKTDSAGKFYKIFYPDVTNLDRRYVKMQFEHPLYESFKKHYLMPEWKSGTEVPPYTIYLKRRRRN